VVVCGCKRKVHVDAKMSMWMQISAAASARVHVDARYVRLQARGCMWMHRK